MPDKENTDEFIARMQRDELADQQWMTPVAYSKIRPISSPQIYQLARNHKLIDDDGELLEMCRCGRRVLNVQRADAFFSERRNDWPVKPAGDEEDATTEDEPSSDV